MKPHFLFILSLLAPCLMAQKQITLIEPAVYYYLPETRIVFEVTWEETTENCGTFYQYAERYLGCKAQIDKNAHYCRLKEIKVSATSVADTSVMYMLNEIQLANTALQLRGDKVIQGLNLQTTPQNVCFKPETTLVYSGCGEQSSAPAILPLLEEQMFANSKGKMAEGVAKLIYRIREARLSILSGDAEHIPADGLAMQQTLTELQKQEQQLTELFTGTTQTQTHKATIVYTPHDSCTDMVLFRFSENNGLLASDDLSGEPYYITLAANRVVKAAMKKEKDYSEYPFRYVIPGTCKLDIHTAKDTLALYECKVAQFGFVAPLPVKSGQTEVEYDCNTGEIKSLRIY